MWIEKMLEKILENQESQEKRDLLFREKLDRIENKIDDVQSISKTEWRKRDIIEIYKSTCIRNSSNNAYAKPSEIMSQAKNFYNDL